YLGTYEKALELFEQVLPLYKKVLGDEHPKTITAMNNLANSLYYLGRYDESLELREQVLSLSKKNSAMNTPKRNQSSNCATKS
ncbi:MAG: tetratricopeptide repeat protein, partial [Selenomonadaceae bacterium]|nr:tetratricopeptide repeat protein [Selenomonadaceae bacterium]